MASIDLHLTRARTGIPAIIWIEEAQDEPTTAENQESVKSGFNDEAGALLDILVHALPAYTLHKLGDRMKARGLIDTTP